LGETKGMFRGGKPKGSKRERKWQECTLSQLPGSTKTETAAERKWQGGVTSAGTWLIGDRKGAEASP